MYFYVSNHTTTFEDLPNERKSDGLKYYRDLPLFCNKNDIIKQEPATAARQGRRAPSRSSSKGNKRSERLFPFALNTGIKLSGIHTFCFPLFYKLSDISDYIPPWNTVSFS